MVFLSQKKRGFTLIELMVVITIVGLLASVVLAAMTTARAKARDTTRVQMVKELQKAVELYRNANGGIYPCGSSAATTPPCQFGGGRLNVNGTSRNTFFDAQISPYLTFVNELSPVFTASQGSITYAGGSVTGTAAGTPNIGNSYAIQLRRELPVTNSAGVLIPSGISCVIRSGENSNTTNILPSVPECF
jgi:prepilin-type N-terminal cleavage/methylation domain-containing protein